jgi:hypothetical protein
VLLLVAKKDDKKVDWMVKISARKTAVMRNQGAGVVSARGFCYAGGVN